MEKTQRMTKQNSSANAPRKRKRDLNRAARKCTALTRRTRSMNPGGTQVKRATKATKIKRNLERTQRRKSGKNGSWLGPERVVDWSKFHQLLLDTFEGCTHDYTESKSILKGLGLNGKAIDAALSCLAQQGGYCDCEVLLNVSMRSE
jgi:hypothetical protein